MYLIIDYLFLFEVEGRKRSMPMSGAFAVPLDEEAPSDQSYTSSVSGM